MQSAFVLMLHWSLNGQPSGGGIEMCLQRSLVALKVKKVDLEQGKVFLNTWDSKTVYCISGMQ